MSSFLNQPNFDARGRLFGLSSFSEEIPFSIPDTTAKIDWFHLSCPGLQFVDVVHIEGTELSLIHI